MKNNRSRKKLAIAALAGSLLLGTSVYAAVSVIFAVGTIPRSELFNGPATVTVRQLKIAPGEVLSWHHHPGRAYNVVKKGVLTLEDGCGGKETLNPGDAFEELNGRIHRAKNLGVEEVRVFNTFIVQEGDPTTISTPNNKRLCGPPMGIAECKNEGWRKFTFPRSFTSQGDCQRYVNTGK